MLERGQVWIPYCGAAPTPQELLARWNFDPLLIGALALAAAAYVAHRRRGGHGQDAAAAGALAVLLLVFVSPLCALSSALFASRVLHHALLVVVAAPLLAWALPAPRRPLPLALVTAAHGALFWVWHAPPAYAWALSSDPAYWLMQASLLGSAFAFWRAVRVALAPTATAALLITMIHTGLLGALITFAASPQYAPHLAVTWAWGLSPLQDQQLAGLIMWAPMALFYLGAALALVGRWMRREAALEAAAR